VNKFDWREKVKKIKSECNIKIRTKESLYYYELFKENFIIPECEDKKNICPDCNAEIVSNSKFCRMCGKFPI
jgi:asparagine synthase (glutamine-hydrolysing)